jgi:hypothetical protein
MMAGYLVVAKLLRRNEDGFFFREILDDQYVRLMK